MANTLWLDIRAGLGEPVLEEYHRSYATLENLADPWQQQPCLITMIGGTFKTLALEKMCPNLLPARVSPGEIHLRPDLRTLTEHTPTIIADCELHTIRTWRKIIAGRYPDSITHKPLTWMKQIGSPMEPNDLSSLTYARLLSPFSTVLCFFSANLGGSIGVARMLITWLKATPVSDLPLSTRPRLLIFSPCTSQLYNERIATREFMKVLSQEAERELGKLSKAALDSILAQQFADLRVVILPPLQVQALTRWTTLYQRLLKESNDSLQRRRQARSSFSAVHLKAFLTLAIDHFSQSCVTPFSFVKNSRKSRPVPSELSHHLSAFLQLLNLKEDLYNFAVPAIASSLVFDSAPPGTHGTTSPFLA